MNIIKEMARHIIHTRFDDLGLQDLDSAKARIMDVIGCMV